MNITVYLPDDIGKEAKRASLKLSRMLRKAVIEELEKQSRKRALMDALHRNATNVANRKLKGKGEVR